MSDDRIIDIFIVVVIAGIIGLKLTGAITISWFWLFSPIIFLFGAGLILTIVMIVIVLLEEIIHKGE